MQRTVERMLRTNVERPMAAPDALASCIQACLACAQACTACADACIAERAPVELEHCIRISLDCADLCSTTARILTRQLKPDLGLVTALLDLCASACESCAIECRRHASTFLVTHVCAAICHETYDECRRLVPLTADAARAHH
jgi:hypothetical protein